MCSIKVLQPFNSVNTNSLLYYAPKKNLIISRVNFSLFLYLIVLNKTHRNDLWNCPVYPGKDKDNAFLPILKTSELLF